MTRTVIATMIMLGLSTTTALACTAEDVQSRQDSLVAAVQALMATDPERAQAIVLQMQADMDAAASSNDNDAVCVIMDKALADATGN